MHAYPLFRHFVPHPFTPPIIGYYKCRMFGVCDCGESVTCDIREASAMDLL